MGCGDLPFLIAPTSTPRQYYEYRIKGFEDAEIPDWKVQRTVVSNVKPEHEHLLVHYPAGSVDQEQVPQFLRNMTVLDSRRIVKKPKHDIFSDLLGPLFREFGIHYVYVATTSADTLKESAQSFTSSSTVTLLGGDTSLHEFVNALPLVKKDLNSIRFAVVPTGSGNALANSVGLLSPVLAIQRLFLARGHDFKPLSTFRIQFPHVSLQAIVVASWGLHSALVADADTPEMRARYEDASLRFQHAARSNLNDLLQVYRSQGRLHSYLLYTCVSLLEQNFLISPKSEPPSSNKLFKLRIKAYSHIQEQASRLMEIMMKAYDGGRHVEFEDVEYGQVHGTEIVHVDEQDEMMRRWCIDGRIEISPPGEVRIFQPQHSYNGWKLLILTA